MLAEKLDMTETVDSCGWDSSQRDATLTDGIDVTWVRKEFKTDSIHSKQIEACFEGTEIP